MCKVVTEGHILTLSYHLFTDAAAARAAEVAQARAAPLLENVRELAACSKRHSKVLEAEYLAVPDLPPLCLPSLDGARGSGVYGALKALVDDPHFLPAGGALSFLAQHAYPVTALRQRRRCGALLRGGDLLLAAAARALGLGVRVDVLFEEEKYYECSADPSFVRLAPPPSTLASSKSPLSRGSARFSRIYRRWPSASRRATRSPRRARSTTDAAARRKRAAARSWLRSPRPT